MSDGTSLPQSASQRRARLPSGFLEQFKAALIPLDPERVDSEGELPEPVLKALAELGALGIKIPRRFGGQEFTQYEYQQVATLCGSFDASLTRAVVGSAIDRRPRATTPLRNRGSESQVSSPARAGRDFRVCAHRTKRGLRYLQSRNLRGPRHRERKDRRLSPDRREVLYYKFC